MKYNADALAKYLAARDERGKWMLVKEKNTDDKDYVPQIPIQKRYFLTERLADPMYNDDEYDITRLKNETQAADPTQFGSRIQSWYKANEIALSRVKNGQVSSHFANKLLSAYHNRALSIPPWEFMSDHGATGGFRVFPVTMTHAVRLTELRLADAVHQRAGARLPFDLLATVTTDAGSHSAGNFTLSLIPLPLQPDGEVMKNLRRAWYPLSRIDTSLPKGWMTAPPVFTMRYQDLHYDVQSRGIPSSAVVRAWTNNGAPIRHELLSLVYQWTKGNIWPGHMTSVLKTLNVQNAEFASNYTHTYLSFLHVPPTNEYAQDENGNMVHDLPTQSLDQYAASCEKFMRTLDLNWRGRSKVARTIAERERNFKRSMRFGFNHLVNQAAPLMATDDLVQYVQQDMPTTSSTYDMRLSPASNVAVRPYIHDVPAMHSGRYLTVGQYARVLVKWLEMAGEYASTETVL